jgi:hypothetical protein
MLLHSLGLCLQIYEGRDDQLNLFFFVPLKMLFLCLKIFLETVKLILKIQFYKIVI